MATEVISDFSAADMTVYEKKGLDVLRSDLCVSWWALPFTLEKHSGKNVRAYRNGTFSVATTPLTEGSAPSDTPMTSTTFSATLAQYGAVNTFSDMLEAVGPSSFMEQQHQIFGIQASETIEKLNLAELVSGGVAFYANGSDSGSFDGSSILTSKDFRRINKYFGAKKVRGLPTLDKFYGLGAHPDNLFDVTSDDTVGSVTDLQKRDPNNVKWRDCVKAYGNVAAFKSQLIGTTTVNGVTAYQNVAVGYGAFAAYDLAGKGLKFFLVSPDDVNVANPLGLKGSVGWVIPYATDYIGSDGARCLVVTAAASEPTA